VICAEHASIDFQSLQPESDGFDAFAALPLWLLNSKGIIRGAAIEHHASTLVTPTATSASLEGAGSDFLIVFTGRYLVP
jgi:hypothetical protein